MHCTSTPSTCFPPSLPSTTFTLTLINTSKSCKPRLRTAVVACQNAPNSIIMGHVNIAHLKNRDTQTEIEKETQTQRAVHAHTPPLTPSHSHTHSLTLTLTHPFTHTHTHSLSLTVLSHCAALANKSWRCVSLTRERSRFTRARSLSRDAASSARTRAHTIADGQ